MNNIIRILLNWVSFLKYGNFDAFIVNPEWRDVLGMANPIFITAKPGPGP